MKAGVSRLGGARARGKATGERCRIERREVRAAGQNGPGPGAEPNGGGAQTVEEQ